MSFDIVPDGGSGGYLRWDPDELHIDRAMPMPDCAPPETRVEAGGRKDDGGKLRWDLIPVIPMEQVVRVYTIGAKKYDDRNWEKGISYCRVFAAMMRHAWAWFRGETFDTQDYQHHLASVVWCALALMQYERTHTEFDDRVIEPRKMVVTGTGGDENVEGISERPHR